MTKDQLSSALNVLMAVADAVKEAKSIPAGTLYAVLMGKVDKQGFDSIIRTLVNSGVIRYESHLLIWNVQ